MKRKLTALALCLALILSLGVPALAADSTAVATDYPVTAFGKTASLGAYTVNGNVYVRLRDAAHALSGTEAQFNVDWKSGTVVITTGAPYTTTNGTELAAPFVGNQKYAANPNAILVNGTAADPDAIFLTDSQNNGYTYVLPEALSRLLGFSIDRQNGGTAWSAPTSDKTTDNSKPAASDSRQLYQEILDTYYAALMYGWESWDLDEAGLNCTVYSGDPFLNNLKYTGYTLVDINHDGTDELLISNRIDYSSYDCEGSFVELYTIVDGAVKQVVSEGVRGHLILYKDMTIESFGSSGADSFSDSCYRLNDRGELVEYFSMSESEPFDLRKNGFTPFEKMSVPYPGTIPKTLIQPFTEEWGLPEEYTPSATFNADGTAKITFNFLDAIDDVVGTYKVYQNSGCGRLIIVTLEGGNEDGFSFYFAETAENGWEFSVYDDGYMTNNEGYQVSSFVGITASGGAFLPKGTATVTVP